MQAGKLRHRVQIQALSQVQDLATGEMLDTWTELATVWANVVPLRGQERFEAQQVQAELSHRVEMRYRPDVTSKNRLLYDGRILEIASVADFEERHRELNLMCVERPDGATE